MSSMSPDALTVPAGMRRTQLTASLVLIVAVQLVAAVAIVDCVASLDDVSPLCMGSPARRMSLIMAVIAWRRLQDSLSPKQARASRVPHVCRANQRLEVRLLTVVAAESSLRCT